MAEVEVKDLENKVVGKLELSDDVFSYEASPTLVWEAVRAFLAAQRKGTHAIKNRSAVRGGGQKPWRQKGTGRARVGTTRSPLWRGGGTVHGPQPRNYAQAFPKKKRRGAIKLVLSEKLRNNDLLVTEDLAVQSHKTKDLAEVLQKLNVGRKALLVDNADNKNLYLSSRNLESVRMVPTSAVNVYDLIRHDTVVISRQALLELQEVLKR